jgi:hypothetical protein
MCRNSAVIAEEVLMNHTDKVELEELGVASVETLGGLPPQIEEGSFIRVKPDAGITAD